MSTIADIQETLDRTTRLYEEAVRRDAEYRTEAARRDAEAARRDEEWKAEFKAILAENARRDEERKAEAARRDAEYKAAEEQRKKDAEKRDAEYKAAIRKSMGHFDSQWGRFIEALVNNQIVKIFQERGIPVTRTLERERGQFGKRQFEFDIIAKNGHAIVVIEVKTTLRPDDVKEFLDELSHFKEWLPEYAHLTVYGAVAYLREDSKASQYAAQQGLFTILATGKSASIENAADFAAKEW
ncbi:MAG: hypothetical protein ACRC46_06880 [Thermoguttaceae bacterium]